MSSHMFGDLTSLPPLPETPAWRRHQREYDAVLLHTSHWVGNAGDPADMARYHETEQHERPTRLFGSERALNAGLGEESHIRNETSQSAGPSPRKVYTSPHKHQSPSKDRPSAAQRMTGMYDRHMDNVDCEPTGHQQHQPPRPQHSIAPYFSPRKCPLPPSPPASRTASPSQSLLMVPNLSDSMIGDTSMLSMGVSDHSLDFGIEAIRPQATVRPPHRTFPEFASPHKAREPAGSRSPTKLAFQQEDAPALVPGLDHSTLLPSSPSKHEHLLTSDHAIARVEPPWASSTIKPFSTSPTKPPSTSPTKRTARSPEKRSIVDDIFAIPVHLPVLPTRHSPTKSNNVATPRSGSVKARRVFPASSSAQSLTSVYEESPRPPLSRHQGQSVDAGDMSALLPTSPLKANQLLEDDQLLTRETMMEENSFVLPPPPPSVRRRSPEKARACVPSSSSRTDLRFSEAASCIAPRVDPTPRAQGQATSPAKADIGDTTLDVKDMMARMTKPKRPSGTEESFEDLLHADGMSDLDATMTCESFLTDLRRLPRSQSGRSVKASSPVKHMSQPVQDHFTAHQTSSTLPSTAAPSSVLRSRSLTRTQSVPKVTDLGQEPAMTETASHDTMIANPDLPSRSSTLAKYLPSRTPGTKSASAAPASSRRISLSTGALPSVRAGNIGRATTQLPASPTIVKPTSSGLQRDMAEHASSLARTGSLRAIAPPGISSFRPAVTSRTTDAAVSGSAMHHQTAQASIAPPATKARAGSMPVKSLASVRPPPSDRTRVALAVPTSLRPPARDTAAVSARIEQRARTARTAASHGPSLPRPGDGLHTTTRLAPPIPSASSVPSRSRQFGGDGLNLANHGTLIRPGASTHSTSATRTSSKPSSSKLSTGLPSTRSTAASTTVTAQTKSRAYSTPAEVTARPGAGLIPRTKSSIPPLTRPTTSSRAMVTSSTVLPSTRAALPKLSDQAQSRTTGAGSSSGLRAPTTTRGTSNPTRSALPPPSSRPTTKPISATQAAGSTAEQMKELRARMDAISARRAAGSNKVGR